MHPRSREQNTHSLLANCNTRGVHSAFSTALTAGERHLCVAFQQNKTNSCLAKEVPQFLWACRRQKNRAGSVLQLCLQQIIPQCSRHTELLLHTPEILLLSNPSISSGKAPSVYSVYSLQPVGQEWRREAGMQEGNKMCEFISCRQPGTAFFFV